LNRKSPDRKLIETQFLPQFTPQACFLRLAGFQPTAWRDPEPVAALWRPDSEEKNLPVFGEDNGPDRLTLDDQ
jgi:hypothetical protein